MILGIGCRCCDGADFYFSFFFLLRIPISVISNDLIENSIAQEICGFCFSLEIMVTGSVQLEATQTSKTRIILHFYFVIRCGNQNYCVDVTILQPSVLHLIASRSLGTLISLSHKLCLLSL